MQAESTRIAYQHAIDEYTAAMKIQPRLVVAYYGRGLVYKELEKYTEALADFTMAIEINPQYTYAYYGRGLVYYALEKYPQALADCEKTIEIDPQFAGAYYGRGLVYYALEKYPQALADYTMAIEIDPQFADTYRNRAHCYRALALEEHNEEKRHEYYNHALEDRYAIVKNNPHNIADYRALFSTYQDFYNRAEGDAEKQRVRDIGMPALHRALELAKTQEDEALYKNVKEAFDSLPVG